MDEKNKLTFCGIDYQAVDDSEVEKFVEKERLEAEKERQQRLEDNYKKNSGVPERYLSESLESYKPTAENIKLYNWFLEFAKKVEQRQNTKNILFLQGWYGTGKTHLGCGLIRKLGGKIVTSLELCITYDSCRDFKSDKTRIQYLKELCKSSVLVIDEIGKGIDGIEKLVYPYIVDTFYGSGKLLVFLGNLNKTDFDKIIGEAGADRMAEVGLYLTLKGQSARGSKTPSDARGLA